MVNPSTETEAALAQEIFLEAVDEIPPEQWNSFVRDSCGENASLQARVHELLAAHNVVVGYFNKPPTILANITDLHPMSDLSGTVIGCYQLKNRIGQGGMGEVYIAHQSKPVDRQVALKVVKRGMDTKQVIARFEIERRALAMMDHPHIAHVFDAGETESGLPYFVMELVQGEPITDYCDNAHLSARDRLRLFIKVCHAVQHAHQKGIIHRDIKPSNVMVTQQDGAATPKIIDFGVAKAIHSDIGMETAHTMLSQIVGTPLYMSSEQAELGGVNVDTRTDIYALGVLLYEMLTGTTPFDRDVLYNASYDEMRRMIREDEPPRPSSRLSTLDGDTVTKVVKRRRTDYKRLHQTLSGDLDWIVIRAIDKDPARRYQTANEFAKDVKRFLSNEPIEARPPSASYRLRKFASRHRTALGSAAAIVCILILGIAVSTWQALEMHRAQQIAEKERNRAQSLLYVSDMKVASDALRRKDVPSAVDLLMRHQPKQGAKDLRGFEWYYMNRLVEIPSHAQLVCPDEVFCISPSPDGTLIATACDDGNIYIIEMQPKKIIRTISTGAVSANYVSWSSDQTEIATADENGNLKTWNVAEGTPILSISAHEGDAHCVLYLENDSRLVSSGDDEMIYMWDRATGEKIGALAGHKRDPERIAVSPDGRGLASASNDGTLKLWDLETKKEIYSWDLNDARVLCVAYSNDGRYIAAGTVRGGVALVDTKTMQMQKLAKQVDGVEAILFLDEGEWLATGDRGGTIHLWPIATAGSREDSITEQKLVPTWNAHTNRIQALAVIPENQLLLSGGRDRKVNVWSTNPLPARWQIAVSGESLRGMVLGKNNQLYIPDHDIFQYDLVKRKSSKTIPLPEHKWTKLAGSSDGCRMAASDRKVLTLYDLESKKLLQTWAIPHDLNSPRISVSPVGQKIAVAWYDSTEYVEIYDAEHPKQILQFPAIQSNCVAFAPDGQRLAYGMMDDLIIRNLSNDGDLLYLRGHNSTLSACAFHPSGDYIATVSHDRRLKLWNARTGECLHTVIAHRGKIKTVSFSPDGNTIATGGDDRVVKLWDRKSGQPLFDFGTEEREIDEIMFTPDNQRLICQLREGRVVIYDVSIPAGSGL